MEQFEETAFGEVLQRFRKRARLTQAVLADRLGAHRSTVSFWERGEYMPETLTTVLEIARVLQLSQADTRLLVEARFGTASILPWHNLPEPNPYFMGREVLLAQLHTALSAGEQVALVQPQAISGLGGIGKTQLALAYAYRYRQHYHDVLWALAESRETLTAACLTFAEQLRLVVPAEHDQQRVVEAVKRWLLEHKGWLLILDNVEDLELVRAFVPMPRQGAVILTTRRHETSPLARALPLDVLPDEEGVLFLLRRANLLPLEAPLEAASAAQRASARAIVEALGGLPLALDQAGAYLAETRSRLEDYLALLQQEQAALLARRGSVPSDHPQSVVTTFALTLAQVELRNAAASDLLKLCAYLASEAIPFDLFSQRPVALGPALESVVAKPLALDAALETLQAYSLVRRDPEQGTLSLHRLVQVVQREALPEAEQRLWAERAVRLLSAAFPQTDALPISDRCQQLLPHALRCVEQIARWGFAFPEAASLLQEVGIYLYHHAAYEQALPLLQQALSLREQALGPVHLLVAESLNNLATVYQIQGQYAETLSLHQRSLAIRKQLLPSNDPSVAVSLNNLAELYRTQGLYAQALPLFQRALTAWEWALGSAHPNVAASLSNLAVVYRAQGQYAEALPLARRALAITEEALGPAHPFVAYPLNTLAEISQALGQDEQALLLAQRALTIQESALGPEHPAVAISLNVLAKISQALGRDEQALPLAQRALMMREQALGPEHRDVAESLNTLARLYQALGQEAEALPLLQRALSILEHKFPDHPTTATTRESLAALLRRMGRAEAADSFESDSAAGAPGTLPQQPLA